jgi:SAM-dependent methyltransferase
MPVPTGDNDYDTLATNYAEHADNNAYNAHYERPASLALVGNPAGLRVLDAGCGPGTHAAALIDGGATVTGLDSSAAMLAVARERLGPDVPLHRADLADPLPLPDAAFDLVLASLVLHYLRDWVPTLREFRRVLVPGGRLVASTHHPFMRQATGEGESYFTTREWTEQWQRGEDSFTMRFWHRPLHAMVEALRSAGFQVDALDEPAPQPTAREQFPKAFGALSTRPHFLFISARAH